MATVKQSFSRHALGVGAIVMVLAAGITGFVASNAPRADAALSFCTSIGNYYGGTYSTTQTFIRGARATIGPDNPDLCAGGTGSPSDSSAWAMVTGLRQGSSSFLMYAQTGYAKVGSRSFEAEYVPGGGLRKFAQFSKACAPGCGSPGDPQTDYVTWYSGSAPTTALTYVAKLEGDGKIHMYSNGVDVLQTGYNVMDHWGSGWQVQYAGEALHPQSDIPGTSANKVSMWNLDYWKYGGPYNSVTTLTDVQSGRFYVEQFAPATGGLGIKIWTYPI